MNSSHRVASSETNRLLVVEDDQDLREMLLSALETLPLYLHGAGRVDEALRLIGIHHFCLVVTDLNLPDGDGIAVLDCLRELGKPTPVVLMTAFGGTAAANRAREAGAFAYLEKPFALDQLVELVHSAIATA